MCRCAEIGLTGMKRNKSEDVRRRQSLLVITGLLLGILAVWTGFLGFVYQPEAAVPEASASAETAGSDALPESDLSEQGTALASPPAIPEVPEDVSDDAQAGNGLRLFLRIAFFVCVAAETADIVLLTVLRKNIQKHAERTAKRTGDPGTAKVEPTPITQETENQPIYPIPGVSLGKIHGMGKRDYQQDSFGQTAVANGTGILAVLADGMGGLSNGERVSQKIIMEALNFAATLQEAPDANVLMGMAGRINQAVNQMLGPNGLYTSGSTLVSTLVIRGALWWISVGDSRVYLYRDRQLNQLSRDHDLLQDWMPDILDGKRSMEEAVNDPDGRKLTSFIGMGELRYVDRNHTAIPLMPGDRLLLMSDGVYGSVSDAEMETILRGCANVQEAAEQVAQKISAAAQPYQDNYTQVILGYDPPSYPTTNRI